MKNETLAPWAESVPNAGPLSERDLLALDDGAWRYELVEGRLARMAPTEWEHFDTTDQLLDALKGHVRARNLGRVTLPDTGFVLSELSEPDTVLSPDLAFVSAEKVAQLPAPGTAERKKFPRVAPDLVVEVASPDQYKPEMAVKARLYLARRVRLVWIVWLAQRQVDVWRPGGDEPDLTLELADTLDGGDVLPAFTLPLTALFSVIVS
jgi:Uma2 family endonuclease